MSALLALSAWALASKAGSASENWGDEKSELTAGAQYAQSKATCRRLRDLEPPASDRPTPAQARALKGCNSEKLYYGEGAKPDYVKARLCAFTEADRDDGTVFSGAVILMQIYANGLGVRRDPDVATALACEIEGAAAESDGRVRHMQSLKTKASRVDYCDDITSGLAEGYCQSRASDLAAVGRDAALKQLVDTLPPAARAAYGLMKSKFDAFVDAHGGGEVDLTGTARAAFVIEEEDATRNQFLLDFRRLTRGAWPIATEPQHAAADARLNASYREAVAWAAGKDNQSTIKPEDVRAAQRAWLQYRDAYVRFAAAAAPKVAEAAVATRLTRLRTAQLEGLSG